MGISIAIIGGVVSMALLSILGVLQGTFTDGAYDVASFTSESKKLSDTIFRLDIDIDSVEAEATNDLLNFTITNNGAGKLWNYEDFDIIIEYDANIGGTQTKTVEQLVFDSSSSFLGSGSPPTCNTNGFFDTKDWIVASITGDVMDPWIINTDEVAQVCTKLSYPIFASGDVQINVSTDLGYSESKSISVP